jgi:hypothetical protein
LKSRLRRQTLHHMGNYQRIGLTFTAVVGASC